MSDIISLAESYFNQSNYDQALKYYQQITSNQELKSYIYYKMAECYMLMNKLIIALDYLKISFDNYNQEIKSQNNNQSNNNSKNNISDNLLLKIYVLKLKIQDKNNSSSEEIQKTYEKIIELAANAKNYQDMIDQNLLDSINKKYFTKMKSKNLTERKKEGQIIYEMMELSNKEHYMTEEALPVNIISMKWLKKWKKYTLFHELSNEKQDDIDECDYEDELDDLDRNNLKPGPIKNTDILSNERFLTDPDLIKSYCNFILKDNLQENVDYVIVSHKVWKFLFKIYGGTEIKRFIVSVNDDTNLTYIEVKLKMIQVVLWPSLNEKNTELNVHKVFLSKKETIKDLKEKLYRIFKEMYDLHEKYKFFNMCKIWKLDNNTELNLLSENTLKKQKIIKAKKLEDSISLEESEITENDIVIIEYKLNEDWVLTTEEKIHKQEKNHCGNCLKANKTLYYCECKQIKYCNAECQKLHRLEHKKLCIKIKKEINNTTNMLKHYGININKKFNKESKKGIVGLQNLGNTCFMNSSLQCLANTQELTQYFLKNEFLKDMNKNNPLGTGGYLSSGYSELIKELFMGSESYVSPWDLKKIIGKFAPQFSGYNQQDSQELLSYLLDGLHEDLNQIIKKPFVQDIEYKNQEDKELAFESWSNFLKRNQSIIIDLFAGQYKSRLTCPDCKKISITFDPFLSISLPIPHTTLSSFHIFLIFLDSKISPYKIPVILPSSNTAGQLLESIATRTNISINNLLIGLVKMQKIISYASSDWTIKQLEENEGMVFIYETYNDSLNYNMISPYLHLELNLFINSNNEETREVTYTRILKIPFELNFEILHLQIYKIMRFYLNNFRESLTDDEGKDFFIDIEKWDKETIEKEYKNLFFNKKFNAPYKFFLLTGNSKKMINYENSNFSKFFKCEKDELIEIHLIFSNFLKIETMRMNRCQDSPFSEKSKESRKTTIYNCIDLFTKEETLDKDNEWYCSNCKQHKQALKKMEIYKTPKILILHLKRFKTSKISSIGSYYYTSGSQKIDVYVDFPIDDLKLIDHVLSQEQESYTYELYAISNHFGGLHGGHYTASCKNFLDKKWYEFNDSHVDEIEDQEKLVTEGAYMLFYRRIDKDISI